MSSLKSLSSDLADRSLRFDGVSEVEPDQLARYLLLGVPPAKLRVRGGGPEVEEFNAQVSEEDQLRPAQDEPVALDMGWRLPEAYQSLDLEEYMARRFEARAAAYTPDQAERALDRVAEELREVEARGMVEFMRTVVYIIDTMRENSVLWGVGRGSSCASYLLFLTGLHVVDCVLMDVPADEFFHN